MHRTDSVDEAYAWIVKQLRGEGAGAAGGEVVAWCSARAGSPAPQPRWPSSDSPVSCSKGGSSGDSAPGQTLAACFQGRDDAGAPNRQRLLRRGLERSPRAQGGRSVLDVRVVQPGFAPTPPSPVQIYRFTSNDAMSWTLRSDRAGFCGHERTMGPGRQ